MAAIAAAAAGRTAVLLERKAQPGLKLPASGGGRANLTNLAGEAAFLAAFGRQGRFMAPAMAATGPVRPRRTRRSNRRMAKAPNSPPYTLDESVHERFDQSKTIFAQVAYDASSPFYRASIYDSAKTIAAAGKPGYTPADLARVLGSWTGYDYFGKAFSWDPLDDANNVLARPTAERRPVDDPAAASAMVKETARFYGALNAGIAERDERWVYARNRKGEPIEIPPGCRYAIVMTIRMDPAAIATSPSYVACAETGLAYSRMAFAIGCMAEFLRALGYRAIPMGNDTALSIPLAVDAGLGEMGRNGLLVTPEHGPCVRICKVFTDLPLAPDRPAGFGLADTCRKCRKCAAACAVGAIRTDPDPTYDCDPTLNSPGVLRWPVRHNKCFGFWLKNGGECSNCIAACPFTPNGEGGATCGKPATA